MRISSILARGRLIRSGRQFRSRDSGGRGRQPDDSSIENDPSVTTGCSRMSSVSLPRSGKGE